MIVASLITLVTISIYLFLQFLFHRIFIRDEIIHAESLREFSLRVSKSLNVHEILDVLVTAIQNTINVKNIKVYFYNTKKDTYELEYNTNNSERGKLRLSKDNIMIGWLEDHNECILIKDFKKTGMLPNWHMHMV